MMALTDTHAFVVTVDTSAQLEDSDGNVDNPSSLITTPNPHSVPRFTRKIRDALSMPIDEAIDALIPWCEEDSRNLIKNHLDDGSDSEADLEPGSKFINIFIVDDSLPSPMSLQFRPAVIRPEHTADAPPWANDEAMWRPVFEYMVAANDRAANDRRSAE